MEESWLGPWKRLLLGHQLADQHIEAAWTYLTKGLESDFKSEVNPALIKAILGGVASVNEVQECVSQLISYKGFFGRGRCCGKDRIRAFSCQIEMLPWENLPVLRNQEIHCMPSMGSILLALTRSNNHYKDASVIAPPFPVIDPFDAFYLLNPSGELSTSSTQEEFDQLFKNYEWKHIIVNDGMRGKAGGVPTAEELVLALRNHDLFLYFGHGSGSSPTVSREKCGLFQ